MIGPKKTLRQYFKVADVARSLKVTTGTVREACANGSIPCVRTPGGHGHYRIPAEYLDCLMRRDGKDAGGRPPARPKLKIQKAAVQRRSVEGRFTKAGG